MGAGMCWQQWAMPVKVSRHLLNLNTQLSRKICHKWYLFNFFFSTCYCLCAIESTRYSVVARAPGSVYELSGKSALNFVYSLIASYSVLQFIKYSTLYTLVIASYQHLLCSVFRYLKSICLQDVYYFYFSKFNYSMPTPLSLVTTLINGIT